jgi:hypothetical protein
MGQALTGAPKPIDPRLFELFCGALETALWYVRQAKTGKTHIGKHEHWPELQYHEKSGMPYVTTTSTGPEDYSETISGIYSTLYGMFSGEERLDYVKEKSFVALVGYAIAQPRLSQYLILEPSDVAYTRLLSIVSEVLDRYIHTTNDTEHLDRVTLLPIYLPMERALFAERLPIVAVVPILFLKFDFPQFQITESISVDKLSDDFHLARAWRGSWSESDESLVESAATHGLFIRGLFLENENWLEAGRLKMDLDFYSIDEIDTFFAAIRIMTGYPVGYAQIVDVPVEWASYYAANITPIGGPRVEKYPPFFKHGYWQEEVPTVTSAQMDSIKKLIDGFRGVFLSEHADKVRLAMHRLNLSALRTTNEDGIIDSIIAMEALLSDGTQEMTYKVALRLAALYKVFDPSRAAQVFVEMKQIYKFRSKIVHGASDLDKGREIERGGEKVSVIDAALEHLRNAFAVLIQNPVFLEPKKIDAFLLTGAF